MREGLRKLFLENLGLKLISFLVAFSIWAFVKGTTVREMTLTVPVDITELPEGFVVSDVEPLLVTVRVRGLVHQVNKLKREAIQVVLPLKRVKEGENVFWIGPSFVRVPSGIEVVDVLPAQVKVKLYSIKDEDGK